MGEYSESFTVDANWREVKKLCVKYLTGFKYKLTTDEEGFLAFEQGSKRKNFFTFSFGRAYKYVVISLVGNESLPVTTVAISFSLPFLHLRKDDVEAVKSIVKALRKYIIITVGYRQS